MPSLTETLPDGSIVGAPVRRQTENPLNSLLGGVGNALSAFSTDLTERRRRRAAAQQAADENVENSVFRETATLAVQNSPGHQELRAWRAAAANAASPTASPIQEGNTSGSLVSSFGDILSGSNTGGLAQQVIDEEMAVGGVDGEQVARIGDIAAAGARRIRTATVAAGQGSLPSFAVETQMEDLILDLLDRFPGQERIIGAELHKLGLDNVLWDDVNRELTAETSRADAANEAWQSEFALGSEWLGATAESMEPEEIARYGRNLRRQQVMLEFQREEIAFENAQASERRSQEDHDNQQTDRIEARQGETMRRQTIAAVTEAISPHFNQYMRLMRMAGEPGSNPAVEAELERVRATMTSVIRPLTSQILTTLGVSADSEHYTAARTAVENYIEDNFIAPTEARDEQLTSLLETMERRGQIQAHVAMPFISYVRAMGINISTVDSMMNEISPEILAGLSAEFSGVTPSSVADIMSGNTAAVHVNRIMGVLSGETTLEQLNLSASEYTDSFRDIRGTTVRLGGRVAGGDEAVAADYLNGFEQVVQSATSVTQAFPPSSIHAAVASITGNGTTRQAINRLRNSSLHSEDASLVGLGARGVAGQLIATVRGQIPAHNRDSSVHDIVYSNGRYSVRTNREQIQRNANNSGTYYGISSGRADFNPPDAMTRAVSDLNSLTDFLVQTQEWDEDSVLNGASAADRREFWATGRASASINEAAAERRQEQNVGSADTLRLLQQFRQDLEQIGHGDGQSGILSGLEAIELELRAPRGRTGDRSQPRSTRNNNPGAMMDGSFAQSQPGYLGNDGPPDSAGFTMARFDTPENGRRAGIRLLQNNYADEARSGGLLALFRRYAPAGHGGNDPVAYAQRVASELGMNPNEPFEMTAEIAARIFAQITGVESG